MRHERALIFTPVVQHVRDNLREKSGGSEITSVISRGSAGRGARKAPEKKWPGASFEESDV
jgi:hypothetical protein